MTAAVVGEPRPGKGRIFEPSPTISHPSIKYVLGDVVNAHASAYEMTFFVAGGIALLGALACFVLVRRGDRVSEGAPDLQPALTLGLRHRGP